MSRSRATGWYMSSSIGTGLASGLEPSKGNMNISDLLPSANNRNFWKSEKRQLTSYVENLRNIVEKKGFNLKVYKYRRKTQWTKLSIDAWIICCSCQWQVLWDRSWYWKHLWVKNGTRKFILSLMGLTVAQDFQHFPRLKFWWIIITTLNQLMQQSWYQKSSQSLVNILISFSWHNVLP